MVFAMPALEASSLIGLVFPGEIAVLVGGVVAHGGALPLWAVIAAGIAGAAIGDQIGYLVGRKYGPGLVKRLPERVSRSGELDRAMGLVRRRGAVAVLLGRWAAALRALVPGVAGMSGIGRV
ncbi:MAG TPA: VTT domain-containing protein, partial [Actinomycetales bacterium]|nr:VTT domain-containing protein [Actinomycetales bacterium]